MTTLTKEQIVEFLAENLTLEAETTSNYTGSSTCSMYENNTTIKLVLCGNVISKVYL